MTWGLRGTNRLQLRLAGHEVAEAATPPRPLQFPGCNGGSLLIAAPTGRVRHAPGRGGPPPSALSSGADGMDPDSRAGGGDVALRVPQSCFAFRLGGGRGVPRADDDLVVAGCEVDRDVPMPPGPWTE